MATKNTFINFLEVSQTADRPRSKSVPPRLRSSSSGESLSLPGTPRSCATAPTSSFSEMAIAIPPMTPVQQVVQVARRCHVKNKTSNSMSSKTDVEAPITHQDHRWNWANCFTDSRSSERGNIAAAHEIAATATEEDNKELLTVMLRNIPCRCTQQDLIDLLTDHGWADAFNFFHVPTPRGRYKGNLGYAFIGFPTTELTQEFMRSMKGVEFSSRNSAKVLDVSPARIQGLNNSLAITGKRANRAMATMCDSSKQIDAAQEAIEALSVPSEAQDSVSHQESERLSGQRTWEQNPRRIKNAKLPHRQHAQHI